MSNEIQTFSNENFGSVRTIIINDMLWFSAKDITDCLGYSANRNVVWTYVTDEDKMHFSIPHGSANGRHNAVFVNESGLYSIIFSSKMPKAHDFKKWITAKVLPEIRRTEKCRSTSSQTGTLESVEARLEQQERTIKNITARLDRLNDAIRLSEKVAEIVKDMEM